jgi:hypothetical protein
MVYFSLFGVLYQEKSGNPEIDTKFFPGCGLA